MQVDPWNQTLFAKPERLSYEPFKPIPVDCFSVFFGDGYSQTGVIGAILYRLDK